MVTTATGCELLAEINRVKRIIENTRSPYLRRDMEKHLKRLEREVKRCRKSRHTKNGSRRDCRA